RQGRFGDFRQGLEACWLGQVLRYKTCRGNLPRLAFYAMRFQHKFVIKAGLLCHLFVNAPLVTSQALTDRDAQNSAMPVEQSTPTPVEPNQHPAAVKEPVGNCHSVITSPPAVPQSASSTTPAKD